MNMKKECENCICMSCINQPVCDRSCRMCESLPGRVSFCKEECSCEQLELFREIKRLNDGKEKIK